MQKYIDELFELTLSGKMILHDIISHRLPLADAAHANDIFRKKQDEYVKVVLRP